MQAAFLFTKLLFFVILGLVLRKEQEMFENEVRYMMATKAIYENRDISREEPDICMIHDEDEENYIGNWITGFAFVNVKFPKETTRKLTEEEQDKYYGRHVVSVITGREFRINTKSSE